jgi:hypothetical protein
MKRAVLVVVALFCFLAVCLVALDFFVLNRYLGSSPETAPAVQIATPNPSPTTTSPPGTSTTRPSTEATPEPRSVEENVEGLIEAAEGAASSGNEQEVVLVISEEEANGQAAMMLEQAEVPGDLPVSFNDIALDFQPENSIVIDVGATAHVGLDIPPDIEVVSELDVDNGEPVITILDVGFTGSFLLPSSVKNDIKSYISGEAEAILDQVTELDLDGETIVELEYREIDIGEESAAITVICRPI